MKKGIIIILLALLCGCRSFQNSFQEGIGTIGMAIFPDTCDLFFIRDLSENVNKQARLPDSSAIASIYSGLSPDCQQSIQDIRSLNYASDSMDVAFTKTFIDTTNQLKSLTKGYRLIFNHGTLKECRILHSNSKYKTELLTNPKN